MWCHEGPLGFLPGPYLSSFRARENLLGSLLKDFSRPTPGDLITGDLQGNVGIHIFNKLPERL